MKIKTLFYLLISTFLLGYAQEWFPFLWSQLQPKEKVAFIGKLEVSSVSKCEKDFDNLKCRETFKIPKEQLYNSNGEIKRYLGLGFFLTDYSVICDGKEVFRSFSGEGYSLSFDSFKVYKTINLEALKCEQKDDIYINAYTAPGLKTYGQISTNALIGTTEFINSAKRAIEFLSTGIYLICSILLLFSWVTKFAILKEFKSHYKEKTSLPWEIYLVPLWAAFGLFKSGLLDIITSTPTSVQILFRAQSLVSLLIHTVPIFLIFPKGRLHIKKVITSLLLIYLPFLFFTNYFNDFLVYAAQGISILGILAFTMVTPRRFGLIFSILVFVETLKVFNRSFLPPGSVTLLFMTLFYFKECLDFLKTAGTFASANLWFRQFSKDLKNTEELEEIFSSISQKMGANRISVFVLAEDENHTLYTYDDKRLSSTNLNTVPGPFAQVISTSSEILHAKADSSFSKNLFKRNPDMIFGDYFSIYPLRRNGLIAGVIAVSKYETSIKNSSLHRMKIDAYLKVFAETISLATLSLGRHSKEDLFGKVQKALSNTKEKYAADDFESFASAFLSEIKEISNWEGFIGKLNGKNLDIIASSYIKENGGEFLTGQTWEMLEENVRAPAPVALHYGRTVYVPNVTWLNENISKNTKILFNQTEMKSFVAIPVIDHRSDSKKSFALVWLSSKNVGVFDTSFENCANLVQETFEAEYNRIVTLNIGKNVFADIIRDDIRNLLMDGANPSEIEEGSLIMADLVGSTAFSNHLKSNLWKHYQEDFISICKEVANNFGLTAELFVWDALYMTSKKIVPETDLLEITRYIQAEIIELNKKYKTSHLISDSTKCVRVCATFGDISKEVSNGAWAIVGHAMARVCKLENDIKKKDIILAISKDLTSKWPPLHVLEKDPDFDSLSEAILSPNDLSAYASKKGAA